MTVERDGAGKWSFYSFTHGCLHLGSPEDGVVVKRRDAGLPLVRRGSSYSGTPMPSSLCRGSGSRPSLAPSTRSMVVTTLCELVENEPLQVFPVPMCRAGTTFTVHTEDVVVAIFLGIWFAVGVDLLRATRLVPKIITGGSDVVYFVFPLIDRHAQN